MIQEMTRYLIPILNTGLPGSSWSPENVFTGWIPPLEIEEAVGILESGGSEDFEIAGLKELPLQIFTRARTYQRAKDIAQVCHDAIHGYKNAGRKLPLVGSPGKYLRIESAVATDIPAPIGRDDKGRFEFSANYILRTEEE